MFVLIMTYVYMIEMMIIIRFWLSSVMSWFWSNKLELWKYESKLAYLISVALGIKQVYKAINDFFYIYLWRFGCILELAITYGVIVRLPTLNYTYLLICLMILFIYFFFHLIIYLFIYLIIKLFSYLLVYLFFI